MTSPDSFPETFEKTIATVEQAFRVASRRLRQTKIEKSHVDSTSERVVCAELGTRFPAGLESSSGYLSQA